MSVGLSFAILMTGTMKLNLNKTAKIRTIFGNNTLLFLRYFFLLIGEGMEFSRVTFFRHWSADGVLAFTLSQIIKREKEDYEKLQEESLE